MSVIKPMKIYFLQKSIHMRKKLIWSWTNVSSGVFIWLTVLQREGLVVCMTLKLTISVYIFFRFPLDHDKKKNELNNISFHEHVSKFLIHAGNKMFNLLSFPHFARTSWSLHGVCLFYRFRLKIAVKLSTST